jgi:hypothetical protein
MPLNTWGVGQDALLGFLANRDAKQRLEEDRARRDRLDVEAQQDRQRQRDIQEGQLRSISEDRNERRDILAADRADRDAKAKREQAEAAQRGELLDAYDAAQTPEEKYAIGVRLVNAGGKLPPAPKPTTTPVMRVNPRTGQMENIGEAPYGSHFVQEPAPKEPKAAAGPKDDPGLPNGVKSYIDSLTQKADAQGNLYTTEQALDELARTAPQLRAAHPSLDMGKVSRYAKAIFPKTEKDPLGQPVARKAPVPTSGTPAPNAGAPAPKAPAADQQVSALLGSAKPGKYTLTDGSVWLKMPDGSIQKGQ